MCVCARVQNVCPIEPLMAWRSWSQPDIGIRVPDPYLDGVGQGLRDLQVYVGM